MLVKLIFNKIYVVESLFDGNWKTGSDLFNDNLRWKKDQDQSLEIDFTSLTTKEEFFTFLNKVFEETKTIGAYPIIHLEIHGSSDKKGLILKSHELITWTEIKAELTKINVSVKNNLLLVLAVCNGAHLMKIIQSNDRAPFWGLIGPYQSVQAKDVAVSFNAFYNELLASLNGDQAVDKLNSSFLNDNSDRYAFVNSQQIFKMSFEYYLKNLCTPEAITIRVENIIDKLKKQAGACDKILSAENFIRADAEYRLKSGHRQSFDSFKSRFFMFDLYPENKQRFKIEFDDLLS